MSKVFKKKIARVIDIYCDRPDLWIQLHQARISELSKRDGQLVFLETLKVACEEGGINKFFDRYEVFKVHAKARAIYAEAKKDSTKPRKRERVYTFTGFLEEMGLPKPQ